METVRYGTTTYAGSYRLAYIGVARYLEIKRSGGWQRVDTPIPNHVRGAYAAASFLGV